MPPVYFDTDCFSSLLWVNRMDIPNALYTNNVYIPDVIQQNELILPWQKSGFAAEKKLGRILTANIDLGTDTYRDYRNFSEGRGCRQIGRGEASAIALAKNNNGIVASNNYADVVELTGRYNITLISTARILADACMGTIITEQDGNTLWRAMLQRGYRLPTHTFSEYLAAPF